MKTLKKNKRQVVQPLTYFLTRLFLGTLILSVLSPVQTFAAVSDFRYRAPITINDSVASYNLLELTDDVLGQTQNGSSDLRIYSGEEEIPYAMVTEQDLSVTPKSEQAEILNRGKDAQGNLQFEVLIPSNKWVKQLTVISSDKNFIRRVKLEGSLNQRDWLTLSENSIIFDLTDEQKARHLEVNFAPTNFPYLRITIYNEGNGTFHLDGVNLFSQNQTNVAAETKKRPYTLLSQSNKGGIQEYTLDLQQPNLPSMEWEIITDEVNFNRTVELYASENNKDWNLINQGEFFVYQLDKLTAKQLDLKFNTHLRYLKLKIYNYDNPSLNIQAMNIKGSNPQLLFPADRTKEPILFWGNSQIKAPVYDIQRFKSNLDYSKTPRASLGHAEENKDYQFKDSRPWSERNSWLLQGILVIVVVALLVIIIRSIRKISSEKD
ncbi:MAG: DUF3999 family protein [Desulfosporosinus sp.]|nr:DUF3999 family protein [Desulfosporosinus sp.]